MKYYHKYQEALAKYGYRVDEHGYVWDSMGNQSAGEDNYGNVQSKDPNVNAICEEADIATTQPKKKAKKATPPPPRWTEQGWWEWGRRGWGGWRGA